MAIKIPESPNIIGSEPVLRSPDIVNPVSETPRFSVDFDDLNKAVGDVGNAYQEMIKEQNTVFMNALKVDYNKHMSDYQQQIFDTHKGKDALNLYERFIRPESNKWMDNAFGEPKDDGHIRIADKQLQRHFTEWVFSQQPTYISNSASYGQKQFDMWRTSVWEQQDKTAANMMLSATSNATIANAINLVRATEYDMNRGKDKQYIELEIAAKVDSDLAAYVNKRAIQDPYGAWLQINNNPIVSDNLSSATKDKLLNNTREAYKNLATSQYADWDYSGGRSGSVGMLTPSTISEVFGVTDQREIDWIIADIKAKGKEKSDAVKKQQAGVIAQDTLLATNAYLEADNEQSRIEAKKNLYTLNPSVAIAIEDAETENLANQQALAVLGQDASEVVDSLADQIKLGTISDQEQLTQFREEKLKEAFGQDIAAEQFRSSFVSPELREKFPNEFSPIGDVDTTGWQKRAQEEDIVAARNNLLSTGKYTEEQVDAAVRVWKQSNNLKKDMEQYKDLSTRIASGELQAYDAELMGGLQPQIQIQLMRQQQIQGEYLKTKKDLAAIGVDLDKVIQGTGADAQFTNLDIASQNLFRRNIVTEINKYKTSPSHAGQLPDADSLQGIVYRVQKNSVSPEMTVFQSIADSENMSAENLTDEQRYSLAIYNSVKPEYNLPKKRGLKEQVSRAEADIDRLASAKGLSAAERMYVLTNKEYLVRLLQAGDVAGIANFIGLAKQGGF